MILEIEAARACWNDGKLSLTFDVIPEDHSNLDLKTGEIFQNRRYAIVRKQQDKQIAAMLFVARKERNAAGEEIPSLMRYSAASDDQASTIYLTLMLPDEQLANLHSVILAGRTPSLAFVSFPFDNALEYTWEPDGSGQKWNNEKNRSIPIDSVQFVFRLKESRPWEIEMPDGYDPEFFADTGRVNFALMRRLSSVEALLGRVSWTISAIAVLIVVLLLSRYWR